MGCGAAASVGRAAGGFNANRDRDAPRPPPMGVEKQHPALPAQRLAGNRRRPIVGVGRRASSWPRNSVPECDGGSLTPAGVPTICFDYPDRWWRWKNLINLI